MAKVIIGVNDFASWCKRNNREDLLAEWDFAKNTNISPDSIGCKSSKMVWWLGNCGHSWDIRLATRINLNTKCPYCSGKRTLAGFNDIQTTHPKIAEEWHPTKNGKLQPTDISIGSNCRVWWLGKCGHEWPAYVYSRKDGVGCPKCKMELHTSFSEQAIYYYIKQYYPDAINGDKDAIGLELDVYIPSKQVAIEYDGAAYHSYARKTDLEKNIRCKTNGIQLIRIQETDKSKYDDCICIVRNNVRSNEELSHIILNIFGLLGYEDANVDVVRDEPYILSLYKGIKLTRSLTTTHPELATEWHPTKNGSLTPEQIVSGSTHKVWWMCTCGNEWQARVDHRSNGSRCSRCYKGGCNYVTPGVNDLLTVRPDLAAEWDYAANLGLKSGFGFDISTPNNINAGSSQIVGWKCPIGHAYRTTVDKRVNRGDGCPYCSNHRLLVGFNDLQSKYPEVAKEWHPTKNGVMSPDTILYGSGLHVWWQCGRGHEWTSRVVDRTIGGCKCAKCKKLN